jgi:hypothetical protein
MTVITGFVGSDADLGDLQRKASALGNVRIGDVTVAPWPQCEARLTLRKALVQPGAPVIGLNGKTEFPAGDTLTVDVTSPGQIVYLYVTYIQADGSVVHLVQPQGLVPGPVTPNQHLTFGDGQDGRQKFVIQAPFGREMVVAVASRSPLFDEPLSDTQNDREYLSALRKALIYKADPAQPDRELSATIISLTTKEVNP